MKCPKHGEYHTDHGCGVAVGVGSAYAEHCLNCPKSPAFSQTGGLFKPNANNKYPKWEAPAGNCPSCWHEANPGAGLMELSERGRLFHDKGNDLAAPEPLANTEPDKSAQGAIEDKLKDILLTLYLGENFVTEYTRPVLQKQFDNPKLAKARDQLQAIITTETTKARVEGFKNGYAQGEFETEIKAEYGLEAEKEQK